MHWNQAKGIGLQQRFLAGGAHQVPYLEPLELPGAVAEGKMSDRDCVIKRKMLALLR